MFQSGFLLLRSRYKHSIFLFFIPTQLVPFFTENIMFSLPQSHFSAVTAQKKEQRGRQPGKSLTRLYWLDGVLLADCTEEDELFALEEWTEKVRKAAENLLCFVLSKRAGKLLCRSFKT